MKKVILKVLSLFTCICMVASLTISLTNIVTVADYESLNIHSGYVSVMVDYRAPRINRASLSLEAGKTYNLTYWLKGSAGGTTGVVFGTWTSGGSTFTEMASCVDINYAQYTIADGEWHKYTAKITPSATADNYTIGIDCRVTANFYVDDVSLIEDGGDVNLLPEGDFEDATQAHYSNNGNDWMTANWINNVWFSQFAYDVHQYGNPGGPRALNIMGTPGFNIHSGYVSIMVDYRAPRINRASLSLTAGKTYNLTYWLKGSAGGTTGVVFGTWTPGGGTFTEMASCVDINYVQYTIADGEWHKYTAKITPAATAANYTIGIDCRVTANFYVDDVSLVEEGSDVNLLPGGDFEDATQAHYNNNGNDWMTANWINNVWFSQFAYDVHQYGNPGGPRALNIMGIKRPDIHGGVVSVKVANKAKRINRASISLEKGKTYKFSYWLKATAGYTTGVVFGTWEPGGNTHIPYDDNIDIPYDKYTVADGEWHKYSATITPDKSANNYTIGIDCRGADGLAQNDFFVDDISLIEGSGNVNLIPDGDFECAKQAHLNGNGNDWMTANWINDLWFSPHAFDVHEYMNPDGPKAISIEGVAFANLHSGTSAVMVDYRSPQINRASLSLAAGKTYNLTYWLKGTAGGTTGVVFGTWTPGGSTFTEMASCVDINYAQYTIPDNKWHKYTAKITPTATADNYTIGIDCRVAANFYVDDVSLIEDGGSKNLIPDGSFQHVVQAHYNNNGNDWMTANWIDNLWFSQFAGSVHEYMNPEGPKSLTIMGSPTPKPLEVTTDPLPTGPDINYSENVYRGYHSLAVDRRANRLNIASVSLEKDKEYTLTFYLKADEGSPVGVTLGTWVNGVFPVQYVDMQADVIESGYYDPYIAEDDGWHKYTAIIRPSITSDIFTIGIDCRALVDYFFVDDVSLVAYGSTVNLIPDGDFETVTQAHLNGNGNDWYTANWVNGHWFSQTAFDVHEYQNPDGPKAVNIVTSPVSVVPPVMVTLTDPATGISVNGMSDVVPVGSELRVVDLGAGDSLVKSVLGSVKRSQAYNIGILHNNSPVVITRNVELSIPLPDGFDWQNTKLCFIDSNGEETLISGAFDGERFVFKTNRLGIFAFAEGSDMDDEPDEPDDPGNNEPLPDTGRGAPVAACVLILCAAVVMILLFKQNRHNKIWS